MSHDCAATRDNRGEIPDWYSGVLAAKTGLLDYEFHPTFNNNR
jgi:hypothetical protein